jgi:molybdenum cofactor cytidylyltransferase
MGMPKALLDYEGATFLDRLIGLFGPRCAHVVAVLGYNAESIAPRLARSAECILVMNPTPRRGQLCSLQCGLRALPGGLDGVFFHPVDLPAVSQATVGRMIDVFDEKADLVVPRFEGGHGHPVLLNRRLVPELAALDPDRSAREVIRAHRATTVYVDVDDPGVVRDIDTPEDYRRLARGGK